MPEEKKRVATVSVLAALFLTATKLTVALFTGSLGLFSEAAHSGLDLLGSGMTFFAVRFADKPADVDHPYGHEKFENLSALFSTVLLLFTCLWIVYEAIERLFFKNVEVKVNLWSYGVVLLAIAVDFSRSRAIARVAKRTASAALEADALHFSSDIYSSVVVLAGLVLTRLGHPQGDAIASVGVSIFVMIVAGRLGKRAVDKLVDRVSFDHVERARNAARSVPGVKRAYDVRVREAGAKHFVDLKVALDGTAPVLKAHEVADAVEKAIQQVFRQADVIVHVEPDREGPRGLAEEALFLAQKAGAGMHNFVVHETDSGLQVDVHLEWPPDMPFAEAHGLVTEVEQSLRATFPQVGLIHTHLECIREKSPAHTDETGRHPEAVAAICAAAKGEEGVRSCGEVRILEGGGRWWVTLTCVLDRGLTLQEAHDLATRVEEKVLKTSDRILTVSVHTEPEAAGA